MADAEIEAALRSFTKKYQFRGKGPLCVALFVTQHAMGEGLPLSPEALLTAGRGQVRGLGKSSVQSVLKRHGIERVLAAEGGRTSRGSILKMREYVDFLNQLEGKVDLGTIEEYWVDRVRKFFASRPFTISLDAAHGLRSVVQDVLNQAIVRQHGGGGTNYAGAVLQHLVGAKLDCALGPGKLEHNSFSTADAPSRREGDFTIGDVVIHVTTAPAEAVIKRCRRNLDNGYRPLLVTRDLGVTVAQELAKHELIEKRIDIFEVEQFLALNLYELAQFEAAGRRMALSQFVTRYNEIVDECETDPSLRIELSQ